MYVDPVIGTLVVNLLSTALLTVVVIALWRRIDGLPAKRDARLTALETGLDEAFHRVRSLHGKLSKVATRREDDDTDPVSRSDTAQRPGESPEDWKKRMRLALANGGLKHRE